MDSDGPTGLVLTRQGLPVLAGTAEAGDGVERGGYVLVDPPGGELDIVLVGTGSEVAVCVAAADLLAGASEPVRARVVSLPSWDLFALQTESYRAEVLPPAVKRLAVEAAASFGWERYADDVVAIDHFGASAPGQVVLEHFGYTPDNVATRARAAPGPSRPGTTLRPMHSRSYAAERVQPGGKGAS